MTIKILLSLFLLAEQEEIRGRRISDYRFPRKNNDGIRLGSIGAEPSCFYQLFPKINEGDNAETLSFLKIMLMDVVFESYVHEGYGVIIDDQDLEKVLKLKEFPKPKIED